MNRETLSRAAELMVNILQMNKKTAEGVLFQVNFFQRNVSAPVVFLIKSTDMPS